MSFDFQPTLKGKLLELQPLRASDFRDLYAVASDPLIWEQHPVKDRWKEDVFQEFFQESLDSGGALIAIDSKTRQMIGSSRFHGYDEQQSEVEIGWTFLARSHWGGVYNREMKELMLRHAFIFVKHVFFSWPTELTFAESSGKSWRSSSRRKARWRWPEQLCLPNHRIWVRGNVQIAMAIEYSDFAQSRIVRKNKSDVAQ